MASPWECVCEFIRSQSANLQNVLDSLGNQHTISDLDTSDTLSLSGGISPLHLFMFLMLAVWGFLYLNGRQRQDAGKPSQGPSSPSGDGSGGSSSSSGGGGSSSSGSGGAGLGSSELF
mmetsp:Transcript_69033/g.156478  ORF Transcript_69033/g.156478 Transcript_69033/m.156478 type:complete len:118 (-) Transcript_69033:86-439(-)